MSQAPLQIDRSRRSRSIDTDGYSERLRSNLIDHGSQSIRLTRFADSDQAEDLSTPPNFNGFGRVHHFNADEGELWPKNPLPIAPACEALGIASRVEMEAQVFQSAGCNWRCWYCYVPFEDLTGRRGELVPVAEMASFAVEAGATLVDLTGGQPDLTPEWPVWMLKNLDLRGASSTFVWSDDNLSTDYLWRYLSAEDIEYLGSHRLYGRACCLKGYDDSSFAFTTGAHPTLFDRQFELLTRLQQSTAINYYLYVTFTGPPVSDMTETVSRFVDRLQGVSETLPLRTIPLRIVEWGPVERRIDPGRSASMEQQLEAVRCWAIELERRFGSDRFARIIDVPR